MKALFELLVIIVVSSAIGLVLAWPIIVTTEFGRWLLVTF